MSEIFKLSGNGVRAVLPPIKLIEDSKTHREVWELVENHAPAYFWTAPAASTYNHHNPYCCGERGLWIHTLMVATAYERLVDSYVCQDLITEREADLGRAAVLLHDLRKYGDGYDETDTAAKDHDLQAAELIREESILDDRVADAVATHMGPWYDGPDPETPLQQLVHQADMAASTKNGTFGIYQPPNEIRELYPSLPGADL